MIEKKFEIKSESQLLAGLRHDLQELMTESGLDQKTQGELTLSVDEAMTNVIRHAYEGGQGKIEVFYRDNDRQIEIVIRDEGKLFDPTTLPTPQLPPTKPGGLGVHFMKTLMDEVKYRVVDAKMNELSLIKIKRNTLKSK